MKDLVANNPSLSVEWRIDAACTRFEAAWKAGKQPLLEEYLGECEGTERPLLLRELLLVERHYRTRMGEPITAEEFRTRLPHDAEIIGAILSTSTDRPLPTVCNETVGLIPSNSPREADGWQASVPEALASHERYRVLNLLGQGGMGAVYEAEHRLMRRPVALKVINRAFTSNPTAVERFQREVRAAARLSHPNIVQAFDAEQAGDTHFLVMEYIAGTTLARLVRERGPLPLAEACDYARQAAMGLQHAHERGMVHRDIKPENLIRDEGGAVKVLDFGLASLAAEAGPEGLTAVNVVMGTPDFMAPEQADDAHGVDIRADVYSLGCTLYFLLTGRVPFPETTPMRKILAHREQPLPSMQTMPSGLAKVLRRMMAKQPSQRYQTPGEVAEALASFMKPPERKPHAWAWAVAAGVLLAATVTAGVVVHRIQTDKGELVITTAGDDVEVIVKQGGKIVRIVDTKTDKSITLWSGVYELELKGGAGLKLDIGKATLTRGEVVLATIDRITKDGPASVKPVKPADTKAREVFRQRWADADNSIGVDLSPDGRLLLSSHDWNKARIWDVASGKPIHDLVGWIVKFTPDGKQVVTAAGRTIRLYDTASGEVIRQFDTHPSEIAGFMVYPDGRTIYVGQYKADESGAWDLTTGKPLPAVDWAGLWGSKQVQDFIRNHDGKIVVESVLPGGREVLGRELVDGTAFHVYDVATGKVVRKVPLLRSDKSLPYIVSGEYGRDRCRRMAVALRDGTVHVLDLLTGDEVARFSVGFAPRRTAISADGRFVACCREKAVEVVVWRLPDPPPPKAKP